MTDPLSVTDPLIVRVLLLILDKVVLAGVLAGAVLLGQRWLENHKARQALAQGLVKLRIDEISKLCADLAKIELELYDVDARYFEILRQQARIVADLAPKNEEFRTLFPAAVDRIATPELVPRLDKVKSDLARFAVQVAQPMFWIPKGVTRLLEEHVNSLSSLCGLRQRLIAQKKFVPVAEMDEASKIAGRKRLTLDTVLARLQGDG